MTNATTIKMLTAIIGNNSFQMENATMLEEANRQTERSVPMLSFFKSYGEIHGYVSNAVCIFGVISNIMNVIVLTRKHMITPTNCILCALAIADMLTMLTYLVYATYFYIATEPVTTYGHGQGWMYFILIHNLFILTCHNMAMWLTVSLAIFRYIFVCHPVLAGQLCSLERAVMTIIIIIVMSVVINVPNYFLYQVINLQDMKDLNNQTGFWIQDSKYVQEYNSYKPTTFWVYGVIMKVAPCILLSLLSTLIILMMKQANKRRARLLHQTTRFADSHDHANCEHNRTTWMLIAVVLFFVITEFPQGILVMISGLDERFFQDVYSNLGDIMDLLVLLNSAVNFILYCIMSQQFRDTFRNLFVGKCCYKIRKINEHQNGNSTHYTTVKSEVTSV